MKQTQDIQKVIPLFKNPREGPVEKGPAKKALERETRVIAITSGKGGVGKTNIVANLGFAFSNLGKEVLVLDADLGLGNLDVLLGLAPKYNLSHVLSGLLPMEEITLSGPGTMRILPASSGIQELTALSRDQRLRILNDLDRLASRADVLLMDTAAGISTNVTCFNTAAQHIVVVVSPEPTSITDAYALMKLLSLKFQERHFMLLVNMAGSRQEAFDVYTQITRVTDRFLEIDITYLGHIPLDRNVPRCVLKQKVVSDLYPDSEIARCFSEVARKLLNAKPHRLPQANSRFCWDHILASTEDE